MNYYLLIPFVIICLMFMPIKLEVRLSFNLLSLSGAVGAFLYGFKMTHQMIWIKGNKIITKKEEAVSTQEIDFGGREILFLKIFLKQLTNKTRLKKMELFYNIGLEDAFASAMVAGFINFFITVFYTRIKNDKPTASLELNNTLSYNNKCAQLAYKIVVYISLFDVVYSLLNSVILTKKTYKKEQQNSNKEFAKHKKSFNRARKKENL